MSKYDLVKMRQKLKEKSSGWSKDPNQFIPPAVKLGEKKTYRFFILPPLQANDKTADGKASRSMELYHVINGNHWINKRPYPCPRIHDEEQDGCDLCTLGFDLMREEDDKEARKSLAKTYMPQVRYGVNVYFPNIEANPEDVRGKIMWFNAPKQVIEICDECLNRDEAGDPDDPKAFGVFFDEENGYLFQLEISHQGGFNEYKSSKFLLAPNGPNGRQPMARAKKGDQVVSDPKRIQEILNSRHDLYTKFEARDKDKIARAVMDLANRTSGNTDKDDAGFDEDEGKAKKAAANKPAASEKPTASDKKAVVEEVQYNATAGEGTSKVSKVAEPVAAATSAATSAVTEDNELDDLLKEIDAD